MNRTMWLSASRGAVLPIAILLLVSLMVVPIPAAFLDIGFVANIMISLAVLMVSYASSMRAYLEQRRHLESLQASIATSKDNIAALEREKARWEDPAYLRAQARERFGWVLPGEIGFQVIDEDGEPLGREVTLSDAEPITDDARPQWWQAAWDSVEVAGNPDEAAQTPKPAERIRLPRQKER